MSKICSRCKENKNSSEFSPDSRTPDGLTYRCKSCRNLDYKLNNKVYREKAKKYREANKEKINKRNSEYFYKNRETILERQRDKSGSYYKAKREREWAAMGVRDFNYSNYIQLKTKQDCKCKICGRHEEELERELAVDHDHETGEVRGLLCCSCNLGIGYLKHNISLLEKSIDYLETSVV